MFAQSGLQLTCIFGEGEEAGAPQRAALGSTGAASATATGAARDLQSRPWYSRGGVRVSRLQIDDGGREKVHSTQPGTAPIAARNNRTGSDS
jgi:hypothetical protein